MRATFTLCVLALVADDVIGWAMKRAPYLNTSQLFSSTPMHISLNTSPIHSSLAHSSPTARPTLIYIVEETTPGQNGAPGNSSIEIVEVIPKLPSQITTKSVKHGNSTLVLPHSNSLAPYTVRRTTTVTRTLQRTVTSSHTISSFLPTHTVPFAAPVAAQSPQPLSHTSRHLSVHTVPFVAPVIVQSPQPVLHTSQHLSAPYITPVSIRPSRPQVPARTSRHTSLVFSNSVSLHPTLQSVSHGKSSSRSHTSARHSTHVKSSSTHHKAPSPTTSSDPNAPIIIPITAIPFKSKPPTKDWTQWCNDEEGFKAQCSWFAPGVTPALDS